MPRSSSRRRSARSKKRPRPRSSAEEQRWQKSGAAERANYALRRGLIRWLRPEFQNAAGTATQTGLDTADEQTPSAAAPALAAAGKHPWPKTLAEQAQAVRAQLTALAATFKGARPALVEDLLETLVSLGQARLLPTGAFVAQ